MKSVDKKRKNERVVSGTAVEDEKKGDLALRPKRLADFIGQEKLREKLNVSMEAARSRGEALEHVLFHGPPGLGKTTLAHIIANEMEVRVKVTSGPVLEKKGDLVGILSGFQPGEILFIDEVHRLPRVVEEVLYPAMEDFCLDIVTGRGPYARTLRLNLPRFTIIGATTRAGYVTGPLRDRFGLSYRIDFYSAAEIEQVVLRSAQDLPVEISADGATAIAARSRGTPRVANRLLRRVRDYAQVREKGAISAGTVAKAMEMLGVDTLGLDDMDRKILLALAEKYRGRAVGVEAIASAIAEEVDTIEDVYEPYLVQVGLLDRTAGGRRATPKLFKHLGLKMPKGVQGKLL